MQLQVTDRLSVSHSMDHIGRMNPEFWLLV